MDMKTTKQKMVKTLLMIIGMITLAGNLMATEFTEPVDHDVKSANGEFNLHVSVKDGIHEVSGEFGPKGGWKVQSKSSFQTFLLSDDGESVAVVDWAMCKVDELDEPAVVIHGREGVRGTFSYRELSVPRKLRGDEVGPIGDFWRLWRGEATLKGNLLTIDVEGRKPCVIDLQTAKLKAPPEGAPGAEPAEQ
jgi:hypothetical protein